jgi:hypothetical protein
MDILLGLITAVVGANALLGLVLVGRYRREQRATRDGRLERIAQLWQAGAGRGATDRRSSAA